MLVVENCKGRVLLRGIRTHAAVATRAGRHASGYNRVA